MDENEIIVDLFAGGGGASEGIRMAVGRDPDVAINHDLIAIMMHQANHPGCVHHHQNIWQVPPRWAVKGRPVGLLWASPDCTHFSKAKGSAPTRDCMRRDLAWVVEKWAREVRPRVIVLENVEEFKTWGPLDVSGRIVDSEKGAFFRAFLRRLRRQGYTVEHRELRACDYGAPTIRKRFFMIARCDGLPIVWPDPTHGPGLQPYRTAADIIDWSIPCPSIFERKRPLAENTLRRIVEGIRRYVVESAEPFIVSYYGPKKENDFRGCRIDDPLPTQSTANRFGLIVPHIQRQFGQGVGSAAGSPVGTITAGGMGKTALVSSHLLKLRGTCKHGQPVTRPAPTITSGGNHIGEVRAFLLKYYGTDQDPQLREPLHTITTKDRFGLVTVNVQGEPYVIADIGMRMLSPRELFRAQGFDDSYAIDLDVNGKRITKADQVRLCGNSVCPPIAAALVNANVYSGLEMDRVSGVCA